MNKLAILLPAAALFMGCSHKTTDAAQDTTQDEAVATPVAMKRQPIAVGISKPKVLPKATAFKMTGDYADHVGVTIGGLGQLTYFPAPSDITANTKPIDLGNGWWLNRQGLGANSVFTKYTFEEYSKFASTPTPQEIMESIIPGARVAEIIELPYTVADSRQHIPEIKEYVKSL